MSKIKSVYKEYNNGEEAVYIVDNKNKSFRCNKITYHEPQGVGDRHYCDVYFKDKGKLRIFEPDEVEFYKE